VSATKELLRRLRFREDLGTSYIVPSGRNRWALVVPTMSASRFLVRSAVFAGLTVREAEESGQVAVDNTWLDLEFEGRCKGDGLRGHSIAITEVGRVLLASCSRPVPAGGVSLR